MNLAIILPVVRHFLQLLAGILVARGIFDEGSVEAFVGLGISLVTLGWWWWSGEKPDDSYPEDDHRGV